MTEEQLKIGLSLVRGFLSRTTLTGAEVQGFLEAAQFLNALEKDIGGHSVSEPPPKE